MSMKEPITKCKELLKSFQKMFSVVTFLSVRYITLNPDVYFA